MAKSVIKKGLEQALKKLPKGTARGLAVSGVLALALVVAFFSLRSSSQALPDCSSISGTAQPGLNCLFFGMPLCTEVPNAGYSTPSSSVLSAGLTPQHRVNCANLSDLPLCNQMEVNSALPGKNCVKECIDSSFPNQTTGTRGQDYAVHNRDCIRFQDEVASENSLYGSNISRTDSYYFTGRNCQHYGANDTPDSTSSDPNCNLLPCNLLTPDELNDVKFDDITKKYCNGDYDWSGDTLKCYKFTQSQLPYVKLRATNTMCKIHDCKPTSTNCGSDDTLNISNQGTAYTNAYITYINAGYSLDSTAICTPVVCKPVVKRQYRCLPFDDSDPTTPNSLCDTSGDGATCNNGYCYQTIDCNLAANASAPECSSTTPSEEDSSIGSTDDVMDSWFYRPKPMNKALFGGVLRQGIEGDLCYSQQELKDNGWGNNVSYDTPFGSVSLGYFHDYLNMDSRSPGVCGVKYNSGGRGTGYIYLCGPNGKLYANVEDYTAFHKGYVQTTFSDTDATHKLVVCLRFNNTLVPTKTCGSRECGITCAFGICDAKACGFDVCRELTVQESHTDECMMDDNLANSAYSGKNCLSVIDDYLRIRAVKYGNRICTFLDVKGQLAYPSAAVNFFTGSEKLSDGTCVSGKMDGNGHCSGGKNTKDSPGSAEQWRTVLQIPYIQNNRPDAPYGYLDADGKLYPQQECIKAPLRLAPPRIYNLATVDNSLSLFIPPVYILNARTTKGGNIAIPSGTSDMLGTTDFNTPEIEVKFGTVTQKLSLSADKTGYESITTQDTNASATLTTTISGLNYSMDVFVRKEYSSAKGRGTFCLYRKVKDATGAELTPSLVQCVDRNYPAAAESASYNELNSPRKTVVFADTTNSFSSSRIKFSYLTSFGSNGVDNNCTTDDTCTAAVSLENSDSNTPTCDSTSEKYKVCAKREECSRLNVECTQNEIDMQAAKSNGSPIDSFLLVRNNCNSILLPLCNLKKGYSTTDASATITDTNPTGATPSNPNAYGWFNELCLSSGFETRLKNVLAYASVSGIKGKCLINPSSPYLTDGNSSTTCDDGGKAPNCLCIEAVEGVVPGDGQEIRTETSREAGLCIDMPVPQTCSAIDYNTSPNTDVSDLDYVLSSLNNTAYGTSVSDISGKVHISHKYRTNSSYGHAEFPLAIMGMVNIEGECNGFWQKSISSNGTSLAPKLTCLNNNGSAVWDTNVTNACARYSCPEISTAGPDESGIYQGGYGWNETGEDKGLSNGFATWTKYTKTNDFPETATANACITGFKKSGATAIKNYSGTITDYSGGSLPTRQCNQLGQWQTPSNVCVRISCSAINPPIPSSSNDSAAWAAWNDSGGATFPATNASRSTSRIQSESIATGTCNNSLGFFNMPGGAAPTRECDSLGNWGTVINPCTTTCDSVTDPAASNSNNGYSYWNQITGVSLGTESDAMATSCVNGYYPYPYPAPRSKYGVAYVLTDGTPDYTTTIPRNVANDNRSAEAMPRRVCKSVITVGGATNVWTATSSSCISSCPGYSDDARIGVGATQHPTSSGTITAQWPSTAFGQTAYITLPGGTQSSAPILTQQDASNYSTSDRSTGKGYYILARYCNPTTHKWDDAKPQCAANNGVISDGNAVINNSPVQSVDVDASPTNPSCVSGYYKSNYDQGSYPVYACKYKDAKQNIDEVYYQLQSGDACEQYCSVTAGQTFGTGSQYASYSGTPVINNLVKSDTQLTLSCLDNYGAIVTGTKRTSGVTYDCGLSPYYNYVSQSGSLLGTYRSTTAPYSICSNGTWGAVINDCSACSSCDFSAGVTTYSYDKNGDSRDNDSDTGDSNNHSGTYIEHNDKTGCCDSAITTKCDFNTSWMQSAPSLSSHQCGSSPQYSLNGGALTSFTSGLTTPHSTVIDVLSTDKNSCGSCERHLDAEVIMKCVDGNAVVTTNAFSRN